MFPCALGPQLYSSFQSLGIPHHCWGHSVLWWPRAFPSCWLEHRVHAAQGPRSPGPALSSPRWGPQSRGSGWGFLLGLYLILNPPCPSFSSKGINTGLGGWESRAGCSGGALGRVCPGVWKSEGEQGAGDIGECSCARPMVLPPRREMPISFHLTGDPLPQVRAMTSGVGGVPT